MNYHIYNSDQEYIDFIWAETEEEFIEFFNREYGAGYSYILS